MTTEELPREILDAASTVRFALASTGEGRHRLVLADAHLGVAPFPGVRVDALEVDLPGAVTPAEVAEGPSALKNKRGELRRLRFSVAESLVERLLRESLEGTGLASVAVRFFADHLRIYLELPTASREGKGSRGRLAPTARAVLCASVDVDEGGNFVLSFYDIRLFGALPAGMVPSALLDRLVPGQASRFVSREGATRVVIKAHALLLTSWLPAAGWKVPDVARANDRHVSLRGDRLYVELSQAAAPNLVSESTSARNLAAFEYAEAERLFEDGEKKLADGDLEGAAAIYRPHADPQTGHPFALRRLAWILTAQADESEEGRGKLAEARALAEGIRRRFPEDPIAPETLATLAIAENDRTAAIAAYETLAEREADETDLRGRVFAELLLGELYAAPGDEQDLDLARTAWEAALALDPECIFALEQVAEVYSKTGDPSRAIHAWWKVLPARTDPASRKALLLRIADTHLDGLSDPEAAIAVYRQAQEGDDPDAPTVAAWEGLARAYAAKGDAPAAIRQLERVADRCLALGDTKGAARANFAIGELWAGPLKRPESALLRYARALELDPAHPGALARRYAILKEHKSFADAVATGARLVHALPAKEAIPLALELSGLAERELSDAKSAAAFAARALTLDPASLPCREAAERLHAAAGDLAGLASLYEKVIPDAPPKIAWEMRMRRAQLFAGPLDDGDQAVREYAEAVSIAPDEAYRERARAAEAELLKAQGRLAELARVRAAQWEAMKPGPARASTAEDVGRLEREQGNAAAAIEWLERAAAEDPAAETPLAMIAEIAAERADLAAQVEALTRLAARTRDGAGRIARLMKAAEIQLASLGDAAGAKTTALAAMKEGAGGAAGEGEGEAGDGGDGGDAGDAGERRTAAAIPPEGWRILGRAHRALGELDASAKALETWYREAERAAAATDESGALTPAAVAAMAAEIASVHAERHDEDAELAWLERRIAADPVDAAATRRAAALARKRAPRAKAAVLVEAEARLEKDRALAAGLFLESGRLWEAESDSARAEVCYRHAAAAAPQDEEPLEALSDLLLGEGRPDDAVELWRRAAESAQGSLAAGRWRRAAVLANGRAADPETAARCFGRLLALEPADAPALSFLAERARAAGAWGKARELFERLAEASADAPATERAALALRRAEACERDGDPRGAEERYREAATLDPAAREPWKAIRRLATAANRFEDAANACDEEASRIEDAAERASLLFEAGRLALERLNDPKRASARFRSVLELSPGNMPALDALESVSGALGDWAGLVEVLREKARRLRDPRRKAELLTRAAETAWEKEGRLDAAADDALAARAAAPEDPRPLALLEKMYRAERKWDLLAPLLDERGRAATDDEARLALLMEAARLRADELGDLDRAATDLERGVLEKLASPGLFRQLASIQKRRNDPAREAAALGRLAGLVDGREKAAVLLELSRVRAEKLDDAEGAIRTVEEARAVAPEDREILADAKKRLAAAGRHAELAALEFESAAAERDPHEAAAGFRRAGLLYRDRVDDVGAAVRAFRRAVAADPSDAESLAAADALLVARGDHAMRAELFRERLRARPDDPTAREGLLGALAASGAWTELEAELKPLADQEPVGGPSARRLILAYRSAGRWKELVRFLEARVFSGEAAARELLEALFAEREDWRGLAEFHLRLGEGKSGRERAKAVAEAARVLRERMGDLDRSRQVIRDAVAERPEDGELFEAALETFESVGDMEGYRDLLVDAAGSHRGAEKAALLRRAAEISRDRLGDSTRALTLALEALQIDAEDDDAGEMASEILVARHDWGSLVEMWTDRGERGRDPKKRAFYYVTAGRIARDRMNDPARAAVAYRAALLHDPQDEDALLGAEETLEAAEKWDELTSLRAARAAREGGGEGSEQALISAAVIARDRLRDNARALALFQQAHAERPDDPLPVDAAAAILAQENRWSEMARWLIGCADSLDEHEAVKRRLNAAEVLLDERGESDPGASGAPGDALSVAVSALSRCLAAEHKETAIDALARATALLERRGDRAALAQLLEAALDAPRLQDRQAETLAALGRLAMADGDAKKAVTLWRRAIGLDPSNVEAFGGLETQFRAAKDWEGLLAIYETDASFASDPAQKIARLTAMGDLRAEVLGDPAGAAAEYKRALSFDPTDAALGAKYEAALESAERWEDLVTSVLARAERSAAPATASALTVRAADLVADRVGDAARAETLYERARNGAAVPDEPLLGLERLHRREKAFEKLARVLELRAALPGDPEARARLFLEAGVLRRSRLSDPAGAVADLRAARSLAPRSLEVLRELAALFRAQGDAAAEDEALQAQEVLLVSDPPEIRAAVAFERGVLARDGLLNPAASVSHFGRAVELNPGDLAAVRCLAEQSEVIGAWPLARQEWTRLARAKSGTERAELFERAAAAARHEGDLIGVSEVLEDAVEADPERMDAWNTLADVYIELRRWDEARLVLGELLARSSRGGDAKRTLAIYYRLGLAERLVGQTEKAAGRLKRLLAVEPDHAAALALYSEILRERQEWGPLADVLTRLAKAATGDAKRDAFRELGSVLEYRLGRPVEAMDAYGNALVADTNDYESMWRLSELAFQNGRYDVFLATWARLAARETAPARKLALAYRAGEALRRTGHPKEAAREYEKALEIDPAHLPSWSALAALLEETREWRRAAAAYDGALRALGDAAPANTMQILVRRGTLLAEKIGDYDGAAVDLKRAVDLHSDDLSLRFRLAGVLAKARGRTTDAIAELTEILRRDPFRPEAYRALGEIHSASNSVDRAFAAYSALALLAPADPAARAFLDAHRSRIDQGMLKAIDDATRNERLLHPAARAPFAPGLVALADPVGTVFPAPIDRSVLIAIDLAAGTPLGRMIDSIRARLGLSALALFVRPAAVPARRDSLADLIAVEGGESPALLVDDTLAAAVPDRRGALFLLGKFLERLKSGLSIYVRLSHDDADHLAGVIKRAFDPALHALPPVPGLAPETLAAMIKALRKAAPRKARREIEELAGQITPEAFQSWLAGLRHTENRAGLLVANDLVQAAKVVLALDPDLGRYDVDKVPDRIAHLRRSDEIAEMLRFLMSEDFISLRKTLGLTLDSRR